MRFTCAHCGKRYVTNDVLQPGRTYRSKCKVCGTIIQVKSEDAGADEALPSSPPAPPAARPPAAPPVIPAPGKSSAPPLAASMAAPPPPPVSSFPLLDDPFTPSASKADGLFSSGPPKIDDPFAPSAPKEDPFAPSTPPASAPKSEPKYIDPFVGESFDAPPEPKGDEPFKLKGDPSYVDLFDGQGFDDSALPPPGVVPKRSAPPPVDDPKRPVPAFDAPASRSKSESGGSKSKGSGGAKKKNLFGKLYGTLYGKILLAWAGLTVLAIVLMQVNKVLSGGPSTTAQPAPKAPPPQVIVVPNPQPPPPAPTPAPPTTATAPEPTPQPPPPPPPAPAPAVAPPPVRTVERPSHPAKPPERAPKLPTGIPSKVVKKVLASGKKSFDICLQNPSRGLATPLEARQVTLRFVIEPAGTVSSPTIDNAKVSDAPVGQCLKAAALAFSFPQFRGDPLKVSTTVNIPASPAAAAPAPAPAPAAPAPAPAPQPAAAAATPPPAPAPQPAPTPAPAASSGGAYMAVEFTGVRTTRSGGEIVDTHYSEVPDDVSITNRQFGSGMLTYTGQVGMGKGSSYAGIGLVANIQAGAKPLDASHYKTIVFRRLSMVGGGMLRLRIQGPDGKVLAAGCYPVMRAKVGNDPKDYTFNLADFTPEGWCGAQGRAPEETLPRLVSIEVATDAIEEKPTTFTVGAIKLAP